MFAHANWQRLLASVLQAASLGLCLITRYRPNLRQEGTSTSLALGRIAVRISRIAADDNPLDRDFQVSLLAAWPTPREISLLFAPSFPNELFWRVMAFWNPRH